MTVPITELRHWCLEHLPAAISCPSEAKLTPASGDAGFRCYFRLNTQPTLLAVHAPPEHEDSIGFVRKAETLRAGGVRVPEILAVDFARGFLLVEDFGVTHCLDVLDEDSFPGFYDLAERELLAIQRCAVSPTLFPSYDADRLRAEMRLFPEWFLGGLLGRQPLPADLALIERLERTLLDSALAQPKVPVHRDFHSRNLMVVGDKASGNLGLGVIDFQDAVVGPVTYDLVSLYRDCYIRWPEPRVLSRVRGYLDGAQQAGIVPPVSEDVFLRWFDLMGLQRHIKVLGIFARLWLRDGKARYLHDLPLVMRYTIEAARRHADCDEFASWFESEVVPRAAACDWYFAWQSAGETIIEDCV